MLILFGAANAVSFKIMIVTMANYVTFLNVVTSVGTLPFFAAGWAFKVFFTKDISLDQYKPFNQLKFFAIAAISSISSIMLLFAGVFVPGPMQTLLIQGVVPCTILLSVIFLKYRYSIWQYIGATILMGGILVTCWPTLLLSLQDFWKVHGLAAGSLLFWMILYFSASFPLSGSSILTEVIIVRERIDMWYMYTCQAFYGLILSIMLIPVSCLPLFGDVPPSDLIEQFYNGAKCLGGINSTEGDDCTWALAVIVGNTVFNLAWTVFILLTIKKGGAALMGLACAVSLPLSNLAFALPLPIIGSTLPTIYDLIGLLLVLSGLLMYKIFKRKSREEENNDLGVN